MVLNALPDVEITVIADEDAERGQHGVVEGRGFAEAVGAQRDMGQGGGRCGHGGSLDQGGPWWHGAMTVSVSSGTPCHSL